MIEIKELTEASVIYVNLDPDKVETAMRKAGYDEEEYFEFIYDKYGFEDGEDFQTGNDHLELGFYSDTNKAKLNKLKKDLGESLINESEKWFVDIKKDSIKLVNLNKATKEVTKAINDRCKEYDGRVWMDDSVDIGSVGILAHINVYGNKTDMYTTVSLSAKADAVTWFNNNPSKEWTFTDYPIASIHGGRLNVDPDTCAVNESEVKKLVKKLMIQLDKAVKSNSIQVSHLN